MARLNVILKPEERRALVALAERERRNPHDQAALLIRDSLQRAGLLPADSSTPIAAQPAELQEVRQ